MTLGKAAGLDRISGELLKYGGEDVMAIMICKLVKKLGKVT